MKKCATVFSTESDEIATPKFAIVRRSQKLTADIETPDVPSQPNNPLQDYVLRVMREGDFSFADVEKAARKRGGTLGRATVQQIAKGDTTNPGIFTLVELAWGLNKPIEEVITVTLGTRLINLTDFQNSEVAMMWDLAKQLPQGDQRFFRRVFEMMEREIKLILGRD